MKPITALISKMSIPLQSIKKINSYSIFFYFPVFYRQPNRLQKLKTQIRKLPGPQDENKDE